MSSDAVPSKVTSRATRSTAGLRRCVYVIAVIISV